MPDGFQKGAAPFGTQRLKKNVEKGPWECQKQADAPEKRFRSEYSERSKNSKKLSKNKRNNQNKRSHQNATKPRGETMFCQAFSSDAIDAFVGPCLNLAGWLAGWLAGQVARWPADNAMNRLIMPLIN